MLKKLLEWASDEKNLEAIKKYMPMHDDGLLHNYDVESECRCACNADCKGDVRKCTSVRATTKKCNHSCHCYLVPSSKLEHNSSSKA